MTFSVKNDLTLFEFHDADFSFVSFDGRDLVISADHVNVHKDTEVNSSEHDMEIDQARITFRGFDAPTYESGRAWKNDEHGQSRPVDPRIIYSGQEAMEKIISELKTKISVYDFRQNHGRWFVDGCGMEPFFTMEFDFDSVEVEWDTYKKKAWYELHQQYRYDITLRTPAGDQTVPITVTYHEETVYHKGTAVQPPSVFVGLQYEGQSYWGYGTDYFWIDAFADLQKHLPEGVFLTCCLTCRHGNLCPFGNEINELFCTKDVTVTQKSDLFPYTDNNAELSKRTRPYCGSCDDYQPQSEDHYTYNDYLYFLNQG